MPRRRRSGRRLHDPLLETFIVLAVVAYCLLQSYARYLGVIVAIIFPIAVGIAIYLSIQRRRKDAAEQAELANIQNAAQLREAQRLQQREQWRAEGRRLVQLEREEEIRLQHQMSTLEQLYSLSGWEFEDFLADLLRSRGYEAEVTRASGDQGVDIILEREGRKIAVQAKLWRGSVGNRAVQEAYAGMAYYNTQEAWIVTPSRFTSSAQDLAESTGVTLIDGSLLSQWLSERNASGG